MPFEPPVTFNIADWFLDARVREGRGDRVAIRTDDRDWTYAEVRSLANRYGCLLKKAGVEPEQRVVVALPDGPEFAAALFGALKIGAVGVMVNPAQPPESIEYFLGYTRAAAVFTGAEHAEVFREKAPASPILKRIFVLGEDDLEAGSDELETFPTHRDDAAIWLFSGGTTGKPKAAVQSHTSYANSTVCYAHGVLGIGERDVTISIPKLYFGYAMGSNLFFPFSVGGSAVLFPENVTADVLFEKIERHRPTILVNVPKMVHMMVEHADAASRDLSSLRLATSAGEALPVELHRRWDEAFGVELLDGLGTAEMWHIFLSNRPGRVRPGTIGEVVPGFEVEVRDESGAAVLDGEVGTLWVRGNSRAIGYWQRMERTKQAFVCEWYVSGDMVSRDAGGYFTYRGRADDMLKVGGKWLSPGEVESCLLEHPAVAEAAVVGVTNEAGLTVPRACVVRRDGLAEDETLAEGLRAWVRERLEPYKYPREVVFMEALPRTHLGKVDRGALRTVKGGGA
ncbi:MAG TPA: benzoate-CoA ligase family protein [Gemmatimonadota bacterium]|nr:benzoate-CoA ligase family protein [Gemmatimonadota bacterium]